MPTFIDETGDPGSVRHGGSPFFRLSAVWVPMHSDAETFRGAIRRLRKELGLRQDYEFKYARTHSHPKTRRAFLDEALAIQFHFAAHSIDKTPEHDRRTIHWECATVLSVSLRPLYHSIEAEKAASLREPIVVDDNQDVAFLNMIKQQFRGLRSSRSGSSLIGRVAFRDSVSDEMLQLADMVCGAVGDEDRSWYELIAGRNVTV